MHIVEGSNHMKLYDVPEYVDDAVVSIRAILHEAFDEGERQLFADQCSHSAGMIALRSLADPRSH